MANDLDIEFLEVHSNRWDKFDIYKPSEKYVSSKVFSLTTQFHVVDDDDDRKLSINKIEHSTNGFNPRCRRGDLSTGIHYSGDGYIAPCCWIAMLNDNKRDEYPTHLLFQEKMKLENNDTIEDIIESAAWKILFDFIDEKSDKVPLSCKKTCGWKSID